MSSGVRGLRRDLIWLWLGYIGRSVAYLGMVYVLTDLLGPSGYGELALFLGLTLGVSQIAGSWPFLSVPVLAAREHSLGSIYRAASKIAAVCTLIALAVAIPVGLALRGDEGMQVWAIVVYAVALVGMQSAYGVFQAVGRMNLIAVTQTLERGFTLLALIVIGVAVTFGVADAEALIALTGITVTVGTVGYLIRRYSLLAAPAAGETHIGIREVMRTIGPMAIVSACAYGVAWVDVFMISAFESADRVGVYTLAYQIFTFTIQIGSLWAAATLPRHARMSAKGFELKEQIPFGPLLIGCAIWAGLMTTAGVCASVLVEPVFGADFDGALVPLLVLLASAGLVAAYYVATPALVAGGRAKFLAKISVSGLLVNVVLNLALIPAIGPVGAAIATAIQTVLVTIAAIWVTVGPRPGAKLFAVALPSVAATVLLAIWPDQAWAQVLALVVGLATLVLAIRAFAATRSEAGSGPG